jgi:hypothetical protein
MILAAAEALAGLTYNPDSAVAAPTVQDSVSCSPRTRSLAPVRPKLTLWLLQEIVFTDSTMRRVIRTKQCWFQRQESGASTLC